MITLPVPPSVNNMYVNRIRGGRVVSRRYSAWRTEAGWELQRQRPQKVTGRVNIVIHLPATLRGDADNRVKPLIDLLVRHQVIDDDRNVRDIEVRRHEPNVAGVEVRAA